MPSSEPAEPSIARPSLWHPGLNPFIAVLLCLTCSVVPAAPADAPGATAIPVLIGQLGRSTAADAATMKKLRPLIARHRVTGPDRSTAAGLPEDAWLGTLETLWIDKQDGRGKIVAEQAQRILHSNGDALRMHSLHSELETVADGVPVIISGYRVGNRVLVTGVSQPPVDSLP